MSHETPEHSGYRDTVSGPAPAQKNGEASPSVPKQVIRNSFTTQEERRKIRAVVEQIVREAYVKGYEDSHRAWMKGLQVT